MGEPKSFLKLENVSSGSIAAKIALLKCITIGGVKLSDIFYTTGTLNNADAINNILSNAPGNAVVDANAVVSIVFSKTVTDFKKIADDALDDTAAVAAVANDNATFGLGDFGITAVKGSTEPVTLTDAETYKDKMAFTGGALEHVENGMTFSFSGGNTQFKNMGGTPAPYKGGKRGTNKKNRKSKGKAKK